MSSHFLSRSLRHNKGQLKIFFAGGPNQRTDFHLEEGEEVFLLPGRIPHSPQRQANTIGFVAERDRKPEELDCLRYFVDNTTEVLFERWFYCEDLGRQLAPIIQEYIESQQYKTGLPVPGTITETPPFKPDNQRSLEAPFSLRKWIDNNIEEINRTGYKQLFEGRYESKVFIIGLGQQTRSSSHAETFLWQWAGMAQVEVDNHIYKLKEDHSMLIPIGKTWIIRNEAGALTLSLAIDPCSKPTFGCGTDDG
ncbi:3-hydroxyanthranilate 3,4-dioxygenase-like isoform X2 [Limulus polyphemus]|uniref:3-hydroxyanthranilate 3,4-dioxygenase-like isoform X2 n=1 Tax=Limulus polyphemus TaxID=6850 RepID=A0ABM1B8W3_LIMPO|nr:3-hydroxyanthranilate 3,4-dioxygenase-like isoform X2 [Limulus polyphemus]